MVFRKITAQKDDDGRRIDAVIRNLLPSLPLALVYKNIRTGFIKLNGKKTQNNERIYSGDCISIAESLYEEHLKQPADQAHLPSIEITTLFKNQHLWIIDKPQGIVVQKALKTDISLDQVIRAYSKLPSSLSFSPGPLHRLDRHTSGILCFSQSLQGARWFSKQMHDGNIEKYYIGLAQGRLLQEEEWKDSIQKNDEKKDKTQFHTVSIIEFDSAELNSITRAKPLAHGKLGTTEVTLIEYQIIGGKTHQIRAQSSHHGYPLAGDSAYRGTLTQISSFFLHAQVLLLPKNDLGIPERIDCKLPQKFKNTLEICLPKDTSELILDRV